MIIESVRSKNVGRSLKLVSLFVAGLALTGCSHDPKAKSVATSTVPVSPSEVTSPPTTTRASSRFSGGCKPFIVYAQNRWDPSGAAVRGEPSPLSAKIGGFAGNEVVAVNGWVDADKAPYPNNPAPFNSAVYFHLVPDATGLDKYVSFAGVRGEVTQPDPASTDGGTPAPTAQDCKGSYNS
jgi:hypothetical protein